MKLGPEEVRRSRSEVLQFSERASLRAATVVHAEMKRGLGSLATIASTAPWIGILGTLWGIVNSFPGLGTSKAHGLGIVTQRLSESLVPTALALVVALAALWCYKYLLAEVEAFDSEMESASLQLVTQLERLRTT
jgi:biopolymer transport protein ExbB/TolQ